MLVVLVMLVALGQNSLFWVAIVFLVFCTFHGNKIVLLYHGYNKKTDSSEKRQQREIRRARKLHDAWKRQQHHR